MKITRRDLGVIMILAGILIAFLSYQMVFVPAQEEIEGLQNEQQELRNKITELQPYVDKAPAYEKDMETMQKGIDKILALYPADIWQEDNIVYVVDMLDDLNIDIPSFSASPASETTRVEGQGALADKVYILKTAGINFSYTVDAYDDMKELLKYVYDPEDDNVRKINSITLVFGKETGEVSGSISLSEFVLTDGQKKYEQVELPLEEEDTGVECIFGETVEAIEK